MGTFGIGGLHRKSTWLYPVASSASLPPAAADGSVAVALDTNVGYQYDALLPGWIPFAGTGNGNVVFNEILTGSIDGINAVFTTATTFIAGAEAAYFNGIRQHPGASNDYTISESSGVGTGFDTITFSVIPRNRTGTKPNDVVTITYVIA